MNLTHCFVIFLFLECFFLPSLGTVMCLNIVPEQWTALPKALSLQQISQEKFLSELEYIWPLGLIYFQASVYELSQWRADIFPPSIFRNWPRHMILQFILLLAERKRSLTMQHLIEHNAQRPNISLLAVAL